MAGPRALAPLRHPVFRVLWIANLVSNTGLFVQNTAAGWLMTALDPSPLMVSLVQASSMLPVFLLALPAGGDGLHVEEVLTEELLAVLPAGHPLAARDRVPFAELVALPFVLLNDVHCLAGTTLSFCTRHAVAPVVTARMHQLGTALELVRLGHGVTLVPAMAAAADGPAVPGLAPDP